MIMRHKVKRTYLLSGKCCTIKISKEYLESLAAKQQVKQVCWLTGGDKKIKATKKLNQKLVSIPPSLSLKLFNNHSCLWIIFRYGRCRVQVLVWEIRPLNKTKGKQRHCEISHINFTVWLQDGAFQQHLNTPTGKASAVLSTPAGKCTHNK